jgi:hypothetical protein
MPRKTPVMTGLAFLAWIPILLSLFMVFFLLSLFLNGSFCLDSWFPIPLFVAYLCLTAFPLVSFLASWLHTKRFSIGFETKRKEIAMAFLIWTILVSWLLGFYWLNHQFPLPGFDSLFACS